MNPGRERSPVTQSGRESPDVDGGRNRNVAGGGGAEPGARASGRGEVIDLLGDSDSDSDHGAVSSAEGRPGAPVSRPRTARQTSGGGGLVPIHLSATTTSASLPADDATKKYFMTLREMVGMGGKNDTSRRYQWLIVINFLVDFDYLLEKLVPDVLRFHRVVVFYGSAGETGGAMERWRQLLVGTGNTVEFVPMVPSDPPRSRTNPLPTRVPYGCHHTKMFLVGYEGSDRRPVCRTVVHTANLMRGDIEYKTQGIYSQEFPLKRKRIDTGKLPEIETMTVKGIKEELEMHGLSTATFLEKGELVDALVKARNDHAAATRPRAKVVNPYKRKRGEGRAERDGAAASFEEDLATYLESYRYATRQSWCEGPTTYDGLSAEPMSWIQLVRSYDYSGARAVLIPSVPGRHGAEARHRFGYLKLRRAVLDDAALRLPDTKTPSTPRPVVCQFSSIGSLNAKWLRCFLSAIDASIAGDSDPIELAGAKARKEDPSFDFSKRMKIIWPTVEEIRTSTEGYRGGGVSNCSLTFVVHAQILKVISHAAATMWSATIWSFQSVPGRVKNLTKPFLLPLYHRWSGRSNCFRTARHVPHIKTFVQPCSSGANAIEWLCLTSHNLSMAAWGQLQNRSEQGRADEKVLFIRNWELGVFISPLTLAGAAPDSPRNKRMAAYPGLTLNDVINVDNGDDEVEASDVLIPLPFDMNPIPYNNSDIPWAVDRSCPIPDSFGCIPGMI